MPAIIRPYDSRDFPALFKLDQTCFPPGIAYTKTGLRYFLGLDGAQCLVSVEEGRIIGFVLADENAPLAHIITLDVAESHRRGGVGSQLLHDMETTLIARSVKAILLETATTNDAAVAFWKRHGYRIEAVLKRYYLGRMDAYEMRKLLAGAPQPVSERKRAIQPGEKN